MAGERRGVCGIGGARLLWISDDGDGAQLVRPRFGPDEFFSGRRQRDCIYVHMGAPTACEHRFAGADWSTTELAPESVLVLPAGLPFGERCQGVLDGLVVVFGPGTLARACSAPGFSCRPRLNAGCFRDSLVTSLCRAIWRDGAEGAPAGSVYSQTLARALAAHLLRTHGAFERTASGPRLRLRRVMTYIRDRIESDLSVAELARVVGMNEAHFARMFKNITGIPPHRYVLKKRMERAAELLRERESGIADIALRCGFASPSSFATAFKRLVGVSPRVYRDDLS